jgi:3-methyladenine DNA glycosylase/8-oxoguanine DNA glycosylase
MTVIMAKITDNKVIANGVADFHPDHIFDNGQCFRWVREADGSYTGTAFRKVVNINYIDGQIILENTSPEDFEKIWRPYLDLDRDYGVIKNLLKEDDPVMEQAITYGSGMRILKQDCWETLISFIISQNNNIPRIKKCIESLCRSHGELIGEYRGKIYYSFPSPETLAELPLSAIDPCRLGYRAGYILETAKKVAEDGGIRLALMEKEEPREAFEYLLGFSGVGPKVANCIMLFSMGMYGSFPLDVWIKRVMNRLYHIKKDDINAMNAYAEQYFKGFGGIAQQYLFYYVRQLDQII